MIKWRSFYFGFAILLISLVATAQEQGVIKPQLLLSDVIQGANGREAGDVIANFKPTR
jgi:hypothetical protein